MDDELKNGEIPEQQETTEAGDDETARLKVRVTELEGVLAERDAEIDGLKSNGVELDERCRSLENSLAEAVAGYKSMVIRSNPEVVEELITGDTITLVDESLEKAKALVSRVKQGVEAEIAKVKMPAGAPERTTPDLSALSPGEKIRYALGGNE